MTDPVRNPAGQRQQPGNITLRRGAGLVLALVLVLVLLSCLHPAVRGWLAEVVSEDRVADAARRLGPWVIVALMTLAVVASPIPSGPIAMAAGGMYGTLGGGMLSAAGALIGAVIAFNLARHLGRDAVAASGGRVGAWIRRPRGQGRLMVIVFASRLVPFISFDAVSYAAGLTNLTQIRFAIATALGVVPMALIFAALGGGIAAGGTWTIIAACLVTALLPLAIWLIGRVRGQDIS